jgi:hypothetical protein
MHGELKMKIIKVLILHTNKANIYPDLVNLRKKWMCVTSKGYYEDNYLLVGFSESYKAQLT